MKNEIQHKDAIRYMLGGKAYVNIYNDETKNQRRFFILSVNQQGKTRKEVSLSNYIHYQYKVFAIPTIGANKLFLGTIELNLMFNRWPDANETIAEYQRNFKWVWHNLQLGTLQSNVSILHLGTCSVCGRPLIDAPSLAIGIGPICLKRIQSFKNNNNNEINPSYLSS